MDLKGNFKVEASIQVKNNSPDEWDNIQLYIIPHMFADPASDYYRDSASFQLNRVQVDDIDTESSLQGERLLIPLIKKLKPGENVSLDIQYEFRVPKDGVRFTKTNSSYMLAQWYPMVATYNAGWDLKPYFWYSESYHTGFSNFSLQYQLPKGYRLIGLNSPDGNTGHMELKNIKELFVGVTNTMTVKTKKVDGAVIRVWGDGLEASTADEALEIVSEAYRFMNDHIGRYPHKQFNVILGDVVSMEYPGIVTVGYSGNLATSKHSLIHELGHQWFYGMVSNDPYRDGWLDEGITELLTELFLNDFSIEEQLKQTDAKPSNLPLSFYRSDDISASLYAMPVDRLKSLFESSGGLASGYEFLHAYWSLYKYRQVDTEEFKRFVEAYYGMKDDSFFDGWIK